MPAPRHTPHASLRVLHRGPGAAMTGIGGGGAAAGGGVGVGPGSKVGPGRRLETGPLPASERFDEWDKLVL